MYVVKIGLFYHFQKPFDTSKFIFLSTEVTYTMAKKVQFVETVLRDANQSLIATRLPFEKFEPMLETIDKCDKCMIAT